MMKKVLFTFGVAMFAVHLPAPTVTLAISPMGGSSLQVVGSGSGFLPSTRGYHYVLESTTNLVQWTPVSTNIVSVVSSGQFTITNIITSTNTTTLYRVVVN